MDSNFSAFPGGANNGSHPGHYQLSSQQQAPQQFSTFIQQSTGQIGTPPSQTQYSSFHNQVSQQTLQQQPQQQLTGYRNPNRQQSYGLNLTQSGQVAGSSASSGRIGQTSSQVAQSLQATGVGQAPTAKPSQSGVRIPKIRLSFLTAQDQAKFEQLFKSAVGDGQALDGKNITVI